MVRLGTRDDHFHPPPHGFVPVVFLPVFMVVGPLVSLSLPAAATGGALNADGQDGQAWLSAVLHAPYPFSFIYGKRSSNELMAGWSAHRRSEPLDADRARSVTTWTDPQTGLQVEWQVTRFADFPAVEWVLWFNNGGSADTAIMENVLSLDLSLSDPMPARYGFVLHRTNGGHNEPTNHGMRQVEMTPGTTETMSGEGGHSNLRDFPYFRIDTGDAALVAAVGWSGQWKADVHCEKSERLHLTVGQETTHFKLHPGEKVRTPRILLLYWPHDRVESNSQFRRLLYKHYVPRRHGQPPLPTLYTNAAFMQNLNGWLNDCNAANQIALVGAFKPLGIEALITDAGWFLGGWPFGAGNWTPDPAKYPHGLTPVAAAAKECGTRYGLWFEPERVCVGTRIYRDHPQWLLTDPSCSTKLANFGLPEVRRHFLALLDDYFRIPGFLVYRQDCNVKTLPYWRAADAPDRQGITEMKYIAGLYEFWDAIRQKYPDAFLEECAGGGPRTDLETIMRFDTHQVSECYDQNAASQASLMGIGQYLPNGVVMTPLFRMDDYSFHSALPSSLCLGWRADGPRFDMRRAQVLVDRYRQIRPLLNKDWYPLTPYSLSPSAWLATQFHSPEEQRGIILAFRREKSEEAILRVSLRGLERQIKYDLTWQSTGKTEQVCGSVLMDGFPIRLDQRPSSAAVLYSHHR
jgi:alpha-galactosidase